MNKKAASGPGFIGELIIVLIIILFFATILYAKYGDFRGLSECTDTHGGRCAPADEGCHITEVKAPWSCSDSDKSGKDGICCMGKERYEGEQYVPDVEIGIYDCYDGQDNDLDGKTDYPLDSGCKSYDDDSEVNVGITEIVLKNNMCGAQKGLKCVESAANNYCEALGYDFVVEGTWDDDCHCPIGVGNCKEGNLADQPGHELQYHCVVGGESELWISDMKCYKEKEDEVEEPADTNSDGDSEAEPADEPETTDPNVNQDKSTFYYINDMETYLTSDSFSMEAGKDYTLKVYAPGIVGAEQNCRFYIMNHNKVIVMDSNDQEMSFTEPCIESPYEFTFNPKTTYIDQEDLEMDVIIFKEGKGGSLNTEDWIMSSKLYLNIIGSSFQPNIQIVFVGDVYCTVGCSIEEPHCLDDAAITYAFLETGQTCGEGLTFNEITFPYNQIQIPSEHRGKIICIRAERDGSKHYQSQEPEE